MKYRESTPLTINGRTRLFSNVNPANESIRKWGVEEGFHNALEFCLTYKTPPTCEKQRSKDLGLFMSALRRRLTTPKEERQIRDGRRKDFKILGIREGANSITHLHYHVVMEIPENKDYRELVAAIKFSWSKVFGWGYKFGFKFYEDEGVFQYNAKEIDCNNTDGLCIEITNGLGKSHS